MIFGYYSSSFTSFVVLHKKVALSEVDWMVHKTCRPFLRRQNGGRKGMGREKEGRDKRERERERGRRRRVYKVTPLI